MSGGDGTSQPGFQNARRAADKAREQPGEWVDLRDGMNQTSAYQKVWTLRHKPSVLFRPGGYEFRSEKRTDGSYAVQLRYVGEPATADGGCE